MDETPKAQSDMPPKTLDSPSLTPTNTTVENSREPSIIEALRRASKYKARSESTHNTEHEPVLSARKPIECLLLGHSMIERFKATGRYTAFGSGNVRYPAVMNCGVGGDKVSNVIYRLVEKNLLFALKESGVRYILMSLGTNDLKGDRWALQDKVIGEIKLVIEALLWACPGVRILVCGLHAKKRVLRHGIVEESNKLISQMVMEVNAEGEEREKGEWKEVEYMEQDPTLINLLEDDGVHLNREGYELFGKQLWERYQLMRLKD